MRFQIFSELFFGKIAFLFTDSDSMYRVVCFFVRFMCCRQNSVACRVVLHSMLFFFFFMSFGVLVLVTMQHLLVVESIIFLVFSFFCLLAKLCNRLISRSFLLLIFVLFTVLFIHIFVHLLLLDECIHHNVKITMVRDFVLVQLNIYVDTDVVFLFFFQVMRLGGVHLHDFLLLLFIFVADVFFFLFPFYIRIVTRQGACLSSSTRSRCVVPAISSRFTSRNVGPAPSFIAFPCTKIVAMSSQVISF